MDEVVRAGGRLACGEIGYVEVRGALARGMRRGRISPIEHSGLVLELRRFWQSVAHIALDGELLERAANHSEQYALRAYDAIHLAALESFAAPGDATFACWDRDLRDAAGKLGYELLPREL